MNSTTPAVRPARKPKQKTPNPIETAIATWLGGVSLQDANCNPNAQELQAQSPKRWVVYEPMVLLPAGSFSSDSWKQLISLVLDEQIRELWVLVLSHISKTSKSLLTHLAVNEGIPLHSTTSEEEDGSENILRSPSGMRLLYGDFGPAGPLNPGEVATHDFEKAFWVSTKQNGIYQTWAPRWTMFSRGNVKEKARLMDFHSAHQTLPHREIRASQLRERRAIDLYAGIGYFVFSYAKLGMRVLCWELNPWSVEGLRRGAKANGWSVRIVQGDELRLKMEDLLNGREKIIVFLEDNREAKRRLSEVDELDVQHVNCGFLPTSEPTWKSAWEIVRDSRQSWLHLHENVGVADIEMRKAEIQGLFEGLRQGDESWTVSTEHVELVKTFAPGVWHCVFDVYITNSYINTI
jgi:tRNA wybutosine-synthesizing protein 2